VVVVGAAVFLIAGACGSGGVVFCAGVAGFDGTSPEPVRSPVGSSAEGAGWLLTTGAGVCAGPGDLVARGTRDVVSGNESAATADLASTVSSQIVAEEVTTW
jgi:hypothetical protein